jgi:threonine dehydrogenase-like Zn-dependent dehydrogenase
MLAARAYANETDLRLEEVDRPTPGVGEVVIQVKAAGLAIGVLEQWTRGMYPILPRTLGNEAAGIIADIGDGVTDVAVGDRVRLHPNLACRRCEYCLTDREQMCESHSLIGQGIFGSKATPMHQHYLDGALAEYVLAPAWLIDPLPDSISFDVAAKVHDIADALRAWKVSGAGPGATIVFTAATGTVGTSFVKMAHLLGVARVIAVARSAQRLEQVRALAPDIVETIALDELDKWGESAGLTRRIRELVPDGPDVVLDFLPDGPGTWQAITSLRRGGSAVLMGSNLTMPPVPTIAIMLNCWRLSGTRGCTREDARQVLSWLDAGSLDVEDLITHRFDLADIASASRTVRERREPTWMVVVHP